MFGHWQAAVAVLAYQSCVLTVSRCVFSLAAVQGSSSSADQPEHGSAERGERPPGVGPDRQSEALAGAGLVEGEPAGREDPELAAGAERSGDVRTGRRDAAGEEEPGLGSCPNPAAQ